ncbi:MAG: type II toxin-antitoxin system VapC family toxin [Gammaproteobacteria bacterium]|nr:type II toxin-antitoxin system VapC family toxin [Gammaproteobacteria bacterium]
MVDASVAVKWLVVEEDSTDARDLVESASELHAPRLLASEVANAIWRKVRLGQIDRHTAPQLVATMQDIPIRWHLDETLSADAARLAIALDRPVYDLMYLALAQRLGARVVTADQRFVNALTSTSYGDLAVVLANRSGDYT